MKPKRGATPRAKPTARRQQPVELVLERVRPGMTVEFGYISPEEAKRLIEWKP